MKLLQTNETVSDVSFINMLKISTSVIWAGRRALPEPRRPLQRHSDRSEIRKVRSKCKVRWGQVHTSTMATFVSVTFSTASERMKSAICLTRRRSETLRRRRVLTGSLEGTSTWASWRFVSRRVGEGRLLFRVSFLSVIVSDSFLRACAHSHSESCSSYYKKERKRLKRHRRRRVPNQKPRSR
jgi:hypothetical protein